MNLLYVTFLEDSELYIGVKNKIAGQVKAVEKLGHTVTYSMWKDRKFTFYGNKTESFNLSNSRRMMQQFCSIVSYYFNKHAFDLLYIRVDRFSSDILRLLKTAKARDSKVIIEIPNYPYLSDYIKNAAAVKGIEAKAIAYGKTLLAAADDLLSRQRLKHLADAVILIGNQADSFGGVPAKNIDNGIDTDAFAPLDRPADNKCISFIGVAGTLWWQGYERVLQGISAYRQSHPQSEYNFKFTLVGGDPKEMPAFKQTVSDLELNDLVSCVGFKSGDALYDCYKQASIGVSSLGCYKRGLIYCSSLKSREYAALGLPFLYAYEDPLMEGKPFALKLANDETPVDIERVIEFHETIVQNPSILAEEAAYARATFDWSPIMQDIFEFAGVGGNKVAEN